MPSWGKIEWWEAIASRVEAIASRLEAIAIGVDRLLIVFDHTKMATVVGLCG